MAMAADSDMLEQRNVSEMEPGKKQNNDASSLDNCLSLETRD